MDLERENVSTQETTGSMNDSKRTSSAFRTDMDEYQFFTNLGCFACRKTEECERFGAETQRSVIQQMWTRFALEIILSQKR